MKPAACFIAAALLALGGPARAAGLFETEGAIPQTLADTRAKIGGEHLRALRVVITPQELVVQVQDPKDRRHVDEWRNGERHFGYARWRSVSGPEPVALDLVNPDLEANLFDLDDIDFAAAGKLAAAALARAALEDKGAVTRMEIARQVFILPKPSSGQVRWTANVGSGRESAQIFADAHGAITGADLAGTNRMRRLDMFQRPELAAEAARDLRAALGTAPILLKMTVEPTVIGFETNLPDKSLAFIATLPAHQTYTWSPSGLHRVPGHVSVDAGGPTDAPFGVDEVDWGRLRAIVAAARERVGMPQGSVSDITLGKSLEGVGTPSLLWRIVVTDPDGTKGTIVADTTGAVKQVLSPKTRRPSGGWLQPAAIVEALAQIDRDFGGAGRFTEIRFVSDKAVITAEDPRQPGQLAQFILDDNGIARFRTPSLSADGPRFGTADLALLTTERIAELQAKTLARLKLPPASIEDVSLGRGGFDPSPRGNVVVEIRAEEPPFGRPMARQGRVVWELDGTVIRDYLP